MEIRVDLADLNAEQMWLTFTKGLPSLEPEELARRAKELGAEPLCQQNAAERIFKAGLWTFWKGQTDQGDSRFALIVEADFLTLRTRLAKLCVDTVSVLESKVLAVGEKHGTESKDYREIAQFHDGALMVIGLVDRLLQKVSADAADAFSKKEKGAPGTPKPAPAPPAKPRKPKRRKPR
jgi:hypothetical protein